MVAINGDKKSELSKLIQEFKLLNVCILYNIQKYIDCIVLID